MDSILKMKINFSDNRINKQMDSILKMKINFSDNRINKQLDSILKMKIIQKHVKNQYPQFSNILNALMQSINRLNIEQHIKYFGPIQWEKTGNKIKNINILIAQTMQSVSNFLQTLEEDKKSWHAVQIHGHSLAQGLAEITYQELRTLFESGTFTIGQLLHTDELTGQYTKVLSRRIENNQTFERSTKIFLINGSINRWIPF